MEPASTIAPNSVEGLDESTLASPEGWAAVAASLTSDALVEARNILRRAYDESITQWDVTSHLEAIMRARGADGPLAFPTLTMSGQELEQPHGNSDDDATHVIDPATEPIVMIDIGCKYRNQSTDVTRTFFFESATEEMLDAYSAVLAAQEAVIAAMAPGVSVSYLDTIIRGELTDYLDFPGVEFYPNWGHGVGFYVHELPVLNSGSFDDLEEGQILAIEPGLFFDDGWAVRVEDVVVVTATGVQVMSDAPNSVADVTIAQEIPSVTSEISITNYDYYQAPNVNIEVEDSASRAVDAISFYDGRGWTPMTEVGLGAFQHSYYLTPQEYSGAITAVFQVDISGSETYFTYDLMAEPENTSLVILDEPLHLSLTGSSTEEAMAWEFNHTDAQMIRLYFNELECDADQVLVLDSAGRVVADYRYYNRHSFWSPWVASDTATFIIVPLESSSLGGVGDFSFSIDRYEVSYDEYVPYTPTASPPVTSPTSPTGSTSPTPSHPPNEVDLTGVMIAGVGVATVVLIAVCLRDLRK
jgi:hypothetical protein